MTAVYQESKYEIETSDYRCHACSREIACEAAYFSAVFFEAEQFRRKNSCLECWKPAPDADGSPVYAFWRTRRPPLPADKPKRMHFDTELILEFFRRLDETAPTGDGNVLAGASRSGAAGLHPPSSLRAEIRFVLALLLIRKKVLVLESTAERDGCEFLKVSLKRGPKGTHWIKNPNLDAAQLEKVKVKIGELLEMQL